MEYVNNTPAIGKQPTEAEKALGPGATLEGGRQLLAAGQDQGDKTATQDQGDQAAAQDQDQGDKGEAITGGDDSIQRQLLLDRVNKVDSYLQTTLASLQDVRVEFMMLKENLRDL